MARNGAIALSAAALAGMLLLGGASAPARAHQLSRDSVDLTRLGTAEIRWRDYTRYDVARRFAIDQWNRLGRVDILPDRATTITDLKFVDFTECGVPWEAFWGSRVGPDVIGFNPCTIHRRGRHAPDPGAVAVHEVGHALRLAHPSGFKPSRRWAHSAIMYYCARCTPGSTYRSHDIADYRAIW